MNGHKKLNAVRDEPAKVSQIRLGGFNFFRRIFNKYGNFRKSGNLPALIFRKLSGTGGANKITNINRIGYISNYINLHFNLYFKGFSQYLGEGPGKTTLNLISPQFASYSKNFNNYIGNELQRDKNTSFPGITKIAFIYPNPVTISYLPKINKSGFSKSSSVKMIHGASTDSKGRKILSLLLQHNRAIQNINYENISDEYKGSEKNILLPVSYPKIALNSSTPSTITYSPEIFNENAGSKIDSAALSLGLQDLDKKHSVEASTIKMSHGAPTDSKARKILSLLLQHSRAIKNVSYENIPDGDRKTRKTIQSPVSYPRAAKIALNSANPATISHLPKISTATSAGSKLDRTALPSGIQSLTDTTVPERISPLLRHNKIIKKLSYENIPDKGSGKNILSPVSYQRATKIALNSANPATISHLPKISTAEGAGSKLDSTAQSPENSAPLLQHNRIIKNISYENIPDKWSGKNILSPISYPRAAKIALNSANPATISHLPKISTDASAGSKLDSAAQSLENATPLLQHNRAIKNLKNTADSIMDSTELVLKKPAIQKAHIVENKEIPHTEKRISTMISDNFIKESFKEKSIHEIGVIADKVYKIIERKISIENDRRGLF